MFGLGRRRRAAAAEAAREAERRALFAQLAQRPRDICPFLGLAYERTGYVDGPSIEHRCFALGDPTPLSAEQQTRVCQERGHGQCPRYLRGLLVTPTAEPQALRSPGGALPPLPAAAGPGRTAPTAATAARARGASRALLVAAASVVLLLTVAGAAYLLTQVAGIGLGPVASASPTIPMATPEPTAEPTPTPEPTRTPRATARPTGAGSPTGDPPPSAGDTFARYELLVEPGSYVVYELDADGDVVDQGRATFTEASFARVEPIEGSDGEVYWTTEEGGLAGFAYLYPDSGEFAVRAVFLDDDGHRRSAFLDGGELSEFPEATPAP